MADSVGGQNINNFLKAILDALSHPVIVVGPDGTILFANSDAEPFFRSSIAILTRSRIDQIIPFGSPLLALIDQVRSQPAAVNEYRVDLSSPRLGEDRIVDLFVNPLTEIPGAVVILFQEKSIAEKFDRQMTHKGAARSVTSLAAMLGHEIKNPLSGIRGAAQLLEASANDDDRDLTTLIMDETDRIVKLVDRMEVFSDERPIDRFPVNIHHVLDHVKAVARNGFAKHIAFSDDYDPSLPPVYANRDQLVQIFLNLIKNAAEAIGERPNGEIRLTSAYRPGIRVSFPGSQDKVALPMEFRVIDNGDGIAADILPHIFDPFITSKTNGSGLGLALVAKLVNDHGGIIECESQPGRTVFKILLPMWRPDKAEIAEFSSSKKSSNAKISSNAKSEGTQ